MLGTNARHRLASLALGVAALYAADRAVKVAALTALVRRPAPPAPARWPGVTILHPITRTTAGASPLAANLDACARLDYPAPRRHLLLLDAGDADSLATCRAWIAAHPALDAAIVTVPRGDGPIAPKIVKLIAGLAELPAAHADDILGLIDDDIAPRPAALRELVAALGPADGAGESARGEP
jgi:hypothetical protein